MILFDGFLPYVDQLVAKAAFQENENWEDKVEAMLKASTDKIPYPFDFIKRNIFTALVNRFNIVLSLNEESFDSLKCTKISLIKATKSSVNGLQKDYGLLKYSNEQVRIQTLEGDHVTIITNPKLINLIKNILV
ncbi:hypothetical protein PVAND_013487 [Polypedilum vanderplanki]|nr:hypothetical protein PVAND_013487 [Polypedilum vanderplanki]